MSQTPVHDPAPGSREAELLRQVHAALRTAPAYQELPLRQRNKMADDLGVILGALADPEDGETTTPPLDTEPLARAQATPTPRGRPSGGRGSGGVSGNATDIGVQAFGNLVSQVDFPQFVSGLIEGVFTSIVDSSIRQMEAYSAMLESVAMSAEQFGHENISDAEARQYLQDSFPGALTAAPQESGNPLLAFKDGLDGTPDFASFFGTPDAPEDLDEPESEAELVRQAKLKMARSRQQQLATMVVLGINRIIVTDGQINAKVVFDVQMEESASSTFDAKSNRTSADIQSDSSSSNFSGSSSTEFEGDYRRDARSRSDDGSSANRSRTRVDGTLTHKRGYDFGYNRRNNRVRTQISTLSTNTTAKSNEEIEAKAKLTGEVKINFRSETFPLERLADAGGLELLTGKARPEPIRPPTSTAGPGGTPPPAAAPRDGAGDTP